MNTGNKCETIKESQINEQMSMLSDAVHSLGEQINTLETYLEPISTSPEPRTPSEAAGVDSQVVELAGRIRSIRYTIEDYTTKLTDQLSRLEL